MEKQTLNDVEQIVNDMLYTIERQQGAMWKMRIADKKFSELRKIANEALSELLEYIENAQEQANQRILTFKFTENTVSVHDSNGQQISYEVFDSNEDMQVYRSQIHPDHKIVD